MCGLNHICESVSLLKGKIIWIRDNLSYLGLELLNFFLSVIHILGRAKTVTFKIVQILKTMEGKIKKNTAGTAIQCCQMKYEKRFIEFYNKDWMMSTL